MKRYQVECLVSFEHVIDASVLEIRNPITGVLESTIETPEHRTAYVAGERYSMSSKRVMRAFCKAHSGKFREVTTS